MADIVKQTDIDDAWTTMVEMQDIINAQTKEIERLRETLESIQITITHSLSEREMKARISHKVTKALKQE